MENAKSWGLLRYLHSSFFIFHCGCHLFITLLNPVLSCVVSASIAPAPLPEARRRLSCARRTRRGRPPRSRRGPLSRAARGGGRSRRAGAHTRSRPRTG